jgi:hypothetical protein
MNRSPLFLPKDTEEALSDNLVALSEKRGLLWSIVRAWLRFAGAKNEREGASIEEQEMVRHSRLLSALLFCGGLAILFTVPTAIPDPTYWIPILLNLSLSIVALILNRTGRVTVAGVFYILAIDVTLVVLLVTLPTGIRNSNIPDFDLFILPILISGSILPKRFIPFIALIHIFIIISLFSFQPHDPLLTQEIRVNQGGVAYSELSDAFIIQLMGGAIAWLGAWSVDRALLRASRAEDLAKAREHINEQAMQIVEQKQRLDYGIDVLKDAQARFANGDFKARARLQNNELAPLAMSFNLLAERLNRITQIAQAYAHLEEALQQLLEVQHAALYKGVVKPYQTSGTLADRFQPIIQRYNRLTSLIIQSRSSLEVIGKDFAQEQLLVAELTVILSQMSSKVHALPGENSIGKAQSSLAQDKNFPAALFGEPSQAKSSPELSAYLQMQIQLLEKAQQVCIRLDKHNKQALLETKQLVGRLPNAGALFSGAEGNS